MSRTRSIVCGAAAVAAIVVASAAEGQSLSDRISQVQQQRNVVAPRVDPRVDTMRRLSRRVTFELNDQRLEDVMTFLATVHNLDMLVHYADDDGEGLDPNQPITISANGQPLLAIVEHIMDRAQTQFEENAWQITDYGTFEVGPKSILNKRKRQVVYPIADLLIDIPMHDDAPDLSLQAALQQAGEQGGGGGANIFGGQGGESEPGKTEEELTEEIIDLIVTIIEPDQWIDTGGDGASITSFRDAMIVSAPDYIHRQIDGYPWWPSPRRYYASSGPSSRWVTMSTSLEQSSIIDIAQRRATAVVGNRIVQSGP
jgi:hypothetical protein